jgi:hypothetical protein
MRTERRARSATAIIAGRLLCVLALITVSSSCGRLSRYTLVSQEYGFSVTFPEKPSKMSDKNREGLPKVLWTLYRRDYKEFYSAQATSYKEPLMTEGWTPGQAVGELVGIQLLVGRRFMLRSPTSGREAVAVATTSIMPTGGLIYTTYIIDGAKLISVTARTENEQDRTAFLQSLTLLH